MFTCETKLDDVTNRVFLELHECVEEEARLLFEPWNSVEPRVEEEKEADEGKVWDILTPMRRKRWEHVPGKNVSNGFKENAKSFAFV